MCGMSLVYLTAKFILPEVEALEVYLLGEVQTEHQGGSPLWGDWGVIHHVTSKYVTVKKTASLVHMATTAAPTGGVLHLCQAPWASFFEDGETCFHRDYVVFPELRSS